MNSTNMIRPQQPPQTTDPLLTVRTQLHNHIEEIASQLREAQLVADTAKSGLAHAIAAYKILELAAPDEGPEKIRASCKPTSYLRIMMPSAKLTRRTEMMDCVAA